MQICKNCGAQVKAGNKFCQMCGAEAVAEIEKSDDNLDKLLSEIDKYGDQQIRKNIVWEIASLKDSQIAIEGLKKVIDKGDTKLITTAVKALMIFDKENVCDIFTSLLEDIHGIVRAEACIAIADRHCEGTTKSLTKLIDDPDETVIFASVQA